MLSVIIISGSIRQNRNSHRVSLHLQSRLNEGSQTSASIIDLSAEPIPLLNDAWDKHPEHQEVFTSLVRQMEKADAFIWVSPEYNGSFTPALKNFVDNFPLSLLKKKPIGIVSVSTGGIGGIRGGIQMQQLALAVQAYAVPQMLLVPQVTTKFDEQGTLLDELYTKQLNLFVNELTWIGEAIKEKKNVAIQ
jgi:NAD(P)H-dependent FMN reductase